MVTDGVRISSWSSSSGLLIQDLRSDGNMIFFLESTYLDLPYPDVAQVNEIGFDKWNDSLPEHGKITFNVRAGSVNGDIGITATYVSGTYSPQALLKKIPCDSQSVYYMFLKRAIYWMIILIGIKLAPTTISSIVPWLWHQ